MQIEPSTLSNSSLVYNWAEGGLKGRKQLKFDFQLMDSLLLFERIRRDRVLWGGPPMKDKFDNSERMF